MGETMAGCFSDGWRNCFSTVVLIGTVTYLAAVFISKTLLYADGVVGICNFGFNAQAVLAIVSHMQVSLGQMPEYIERVSLSIP